MRNIISLVWGILLAVQFYKGARLWINTAIKTHFEYVLVEFSVHMNCALWSLSIWNAVNYVILHVTSIDDGHRTKSLIFKKIHLYKQFPSQMWPKKVFLWLNIDNEEITLSDVCIDLDAHARDLNYKCIFFLLFTNYNYLKRLICPFDTIDLA